MKQTKVRSFGERQLFTRQWLWSGTNTPFDFLKIIIMVGGLSLLLFPVTFLGSVFEDHMPILEAFSKTWWLLLLALVFLFTMRRNEYSELPAKGHIYSYLVGSTFNNDGIIWCPRCEEKGIKTEHGNVQQCPRCNLWIVRYGMGIHMAQNKVDL